MHYDPPELRGQIGAKNMDDKTVVGGSCALAGVVITWVTNYFTFGRRIGKLEEKVSTPAVNETTCELKRQNILQKFESGDQQFTDIKEEMAQINKTMTANHREIMSMIMSFLQSRK